MYSVFPASKVCGAGRQRGAALILALVVFSIVALLAGSLSMDLLVTARRVENQLHGQQASAFLRGAEGLARSVVQLDSQSSKDKDHLSEGWLNNPQEFPMETGVISGVICDLQARFNLNNLAAAAPTSGSYTVDQEMFIRLLQTLQLEEPLDLAQAQDIASAVIDWIDANDDIHRTGGAEEGYYSDLDPPYRAGNRMLVSVSELRWVRGITDEIFLALEPHVAALEAGTSINVNTAGVEVLRSINEVGNLEPISESDALAIIDSRDGDTASGNPANIEDGFDSVADFIAVHPLTTLAGANFDIRSDYFLLDSRLLFLERQFSLYSVLHRDTNNMIKTLARAQSGLGSCR